MMTSFTSCEAQIKNAKSENVKIFGNCGMCETTIEKAGNIKKVAKVDWNIDTKMATITYDSKKTNADEILKRIALSGYDNEKFLAPNNVYAELPQCCQYERKAQTKIKEDVAATDEHSMEKHAVHKEHKPVVAVETEQVQHELEAVFDHYFAVKDALVSTDGKNAAIHAKKLHKAIQSVKMARLTTEEHNVWMKVMKELNLYAERIAGTNDVTLQREKFITLSNNMYQLISVSKQESPTYYQHCPMANEGKGAHWLSKENVVKNPYYGSQMLNCGKVVETIK